MERYGSDSLSYFALRTDKDWFGYRDTVVAYRVHNGIALVSPDPVGPVSQRADAWAAFREFADEHGWSVAVMAACGDWLPVYGASGMHDLYIGDEAVVDVRRFSLDGKQNKSLRQSVSRVRKAGYRVEMFDPAKLDPALEQQLRELMTESRKGDVERGFSMTLGRAFEQRRPRSAARGRVRRQRPAGRVLPVRSRARDLRLVARPHAPIGAGRSSQRADRARRRRHDRAPPTRGLRRASRSTSRRSERCSRARPAIASCTASRSGSSSA